MKEEIRKYNTNQIAAYRQICERLDTTINLNLPEADSKIWHGHPVWFIDGNPVVGYSIQKPGVRLMFWSGADFDEEELNVRGKKFKDASIFYQSVLDLDQGKLVRWLEKSRSIQWDYKNIVKRKGRLERLHGGYEMKRDV